MLSWSKHTPVSKTIQGGQAFSTSPLMLLHWKTVIRKRTTISNLTLTLTEGQEGILGGDIYIYILSKPCDILWKSPENSCTVSLYTCQFMALSTLLRGIFHGICTESGCPISSDICVLEHSTTFFPLDFLYMYSLHVDYTKTIIISCMPRAVEKTKKNYTCIYWPVHVLMRTYLIHQYTSEFVHFSYMECPNWLCRRLL